MFGLGCTCSDGGSLLSGLGALGDVSYGGDYFKAGVQIPYGFGGGNYQAIADAMNASGEFYSVSAYQTAGTINPWVTVEGFLVDGSYYTNPYELQSKIMEYVNSVTHSVDPSTWQWVDLETHPEPAGTGVPRRSINTQPQPAPSNAPSSFSLPTLNQAAAAFGISSGLALAIGGIAAVLILPKLLR